MRNLIALSAVAFSLACAFALAGSQDLSSNPSPAESPGMVGTEEPGTSSDMDSTKSTTEKSQKVSKRAKSCTDSSGVSHMRNQKGYERCMKEKHSGDQAGVSSQTSSQTSSSESSMNSGTTTGTDSGNSYGGAGGTAGSMTGMMGITGATGSMENKDISGGSPGTAGSSGSDTGSSTY